MDGEFAESTSALDGAWATIAVVVLVAVAVVLFSSSVMSACLKESSRVDHGGGDDDVSIAGWRVAVRDIVGEVMVNEGAEDVEGRNLAFEGSVTRYLNAVPLTSASAGSVRYNVLSIPRIGYPLAMHL